MKNHTVTNHQDGLSPAAASCHTLLGNLSKQTAPKLKSDKATRPADEWQSASVLLDLPQTNAALFHTLLMGMLAMDDAQALQTVYPSLKCLGPQPCPSPAMSCISPIQTEHPMTADKDYPLGFAVRAHDGHGAAIAYAAHEMRDIHGGMRLKSTIALPGALPCSRLQGHLDHFAAEFGHWHAAAMSGGSTWAGLLL